MSYAEDIEQIYSDGAEEDTTSIRSEKYLIANIIHRALLDVKLFFESDPNRRSITKGRLASDAHAWIHNTTTPRDTPFSFVWCCGVIYPKCVDTVVAKLRKATITPIDLTLCQDTPLPRVSIKLKKGMANVTRDRSKILATIDMPLDYKRIPQVIS